MNKNKYILVKYAAMLTAAIAGVVATWASDEEIKLQAHEDVKEYLNEKEKNNEEQ